MRVVCIAVLLVSGASGEISECVAGLDGSHTCHEAIPLSDATIFMQLPSATHAKPAQNDAASADVLPTNTPPGLNYDRPEPEGSGDYADTASEDPPQEEPPNVDEENICPGLEEVREGCRKLAASQAAALDQGGEEGQELVDSAARPYCPPESEIEAYFKDQDIDNDGRLCPEEVAHAIARGGSAPASGQNALVERRRADLSTTQRLAEIERLFRAGRLENHTHLQMLLDLFGEAPHQGERQVGEEDLPGFTQHPDDHWTLPERHPAADGSIPSRNVSFGPPSVHSASPVGKQFAREGLSQAAASLSPRRRRISFRTPAYYGKSAGECDVKSPHKVGDGRCQKTSANYNTLACMYDGGDCCKETCTSVKYECGSAGYDCKNNAVKDYQILNPYFPDAGVDVHSFRALYAWAKTALAKGCQSWGGESLTEGEWKNLLLAFNRGTVIFDKKHVPSTSCGNNMCGCKHFYNGKGKFGHQAGTDLCCGLGALDEFGTGLCSRKGKYNPEDAWTRALFIHEMAHTAGYFHGSFEKENEWGSCEAIGSWHDHCNGDRCKTLGDSCMTHWHSDSNSCGWWNLGCQAKCVKATYSMTVPERAPWCVRVRRGVRCEAQ